MRRWVFIGLLGLLACGPPKAASDGGESTQGDEGVGESGGTDGESTTTSGEDESNDEGRVFVGGSDIPTHEPCTVFEQDCPEGEKCIPTSSANWGIYKCVPISGDKRVGEACVLYEGQADDCDANSHCRHAKLNEQGEYEGTCIPFCQGEQYNAWCPGQDESCDDFRCVFFGQDGIPYCVQTCDLFLGGCADEGLNCHYEQGYVDDFICMVKTIEAQLGEPCDWTNDCADGLFCANAEYLPSCSHSRCCTSYCELGDDAGCAAQVPGTGCYGPLIWSTPVREECSQVGACSFEW